MNFLLKALYWLPVVLTAFLAACGSNETTINEGEATPISVLDDTETFHESDCDSSNIGQMVYVKDLAKVYYCTGKDWHMLNGVDGKDGIDGVDGKDGKDGENGVNGISGSECSITRFSDGYMLVCGSTSAALRLDMDVPDTCSIKAQGDTAFVLSCGDSTAILKNGDNGVAGSGCTQKDLKDGYVELTCGETSIKTAKAYCGEIPYDPAGEFFCFKNMLVERCDGKVFDAERQFCFESELIDLCGGQEYDPINKGCRHDEDFVFVPICGDEPFDDGVSFCVDGQLYPLCGGKSYNPAAKFCVNGEVMDLCAGEAYDPKLFSCERNVLYTRCGTDQYLSSTSFCFRERVYDLCDGKTYDPYRQACVRNEILPRCDGIVSYNPETSFCFESKVYPLCNDAPFDPNVSFCYKGVVLSKCKGYAYDPEETSCEEQTAIPAYIMDRRDQRIYKTVTIGEQTWIDQNLNYEIPGSLCLNNQYENCLIHGRLYDWYMAMDLPSICKRDASPEECQVDDAHHQGICPDGFRIPSARDYKQLLDYVQANAHFDLTYRNLGYALVNADLWDSNLRGATNEFGFNASLAGGFNVNVGTGYSGTNNFIIYFTDIWSSTTYGSSKDCNLTVPSGPVSDNVACYLYISHDGGVGIYASGSMKIHLRSVRCIKEVEHEIY